MLFYDYHSQKFSAHVSYVYYLTAPLFLALKLLQHITSLYSQMSWVIANELIHHPPKLSRVMSWDISPSIQSTAVV
jgi:hypothetical protein